MSYFGNMKVFCSICQREFDGMHGYGHKGNCCSMDCAHEWEWRKTLAILNKAYYDRPKQRQP